MPNKTIREAVQGAELFVSWTVRARHRAAAIVVIAIAGLGATGFAQQSDAPPAAAAAPAQNLPDIETRLEVARSAVKKHSTRLKADLSQALKEGGPKGAIGACVSIAPEIDASVSEEHQVEIGRTSTRVRNTENAPDEWELAGMETFAKQIAAGGDSQKLEYYEVTMTTEGQRLFRYMKPIMMQEMCLACHGSNLSQDLKSEIAKSYPDDKAVGFNLSELRGAFTLVQRVD